MIKYALLMISYLPAIFIWGKLTAPLTTTLWFLGGTMKLGYKTAVAAALGVAFATTASAADELTIAIVNNGHMINMQKVAEAYTAETGTKLNWVSLEEGVLREQVTSDTATGGGQYDIINIGMQEASELQR